MIFFEKRRQAFEDFGGTVWGLIGRDVCVNGAIKLRLFITDGWGFGMFVGGFKGVEKRLFLAFEYECHKLLQKKEENL